MIDFSKKRNIFKYIYSIISCMLQKSITKREGEFSFPGSIENYRTTFIFSEENYRNFISYQKIIRSSIDIVSNAL